MFIIAVFIYVCIFKNLLHCCRPMLFVKKKKMQREKFYYIFFSSHIHQQLALQEKTNCCKRVWTRGL